MAGVPVFSRLVVEVDPSTFVGRLKLARPDQANAIDLTTWEELPRALRWLEEQGARAIVLLGERSTCGRSQQRRSIGGGHQAAQCRPASTSKVAPLWHPTLDANSFQAFKNTQFATCMLGWVPHKLGSVRHIGPVFRGPVRHHA